MSSLNGDQIYSGDLSNTPKPYDDVSERTGSRLEKNESLASSSSRNELGGRRDTQGRVEPAEDEGGALLDLLPPPEGAPVAAAAFACAFAALCFS